MKISDIINGPWAITPDMLSEVRSIYAKHLRGEKIDIRAIEAATGKTLKNRPQGYDVINGSAIISVQGVIAKRMNLFMDISGGASTQLIERDLRDALADLSVEQIILSIDSPGGTVDGTFELADFIFSCRGEKPIIAHTDGMMCSAAYAIGAAADRIYISTDTAAVGSIGVVTAHEDVSKMEEKMGIKTTEIYAGKYKRIDSQYAPLTDEGRASIQERIDYLHSIFVGKIAKFRGVTPERVAATMSTDVKPYFIGEQAIQAGLVDGVATLDRLINDTADGVSADKKKKETIMNLTELKEKHPDIYQAAFEEGIASCTASHAEAVAAARKEGIAAEQARIKAVKEQSITGHEALIETLMFDGKTTGEQAAVQILAAEKALRTKKADDFKEDGADIAKVPASDGTDASASKIMKRADFDKLSPADQRAKLKDGYKVVD